jgi:branched-chain amino acid transport system ATP-binding protein
MHLLEGEGVTKHFGGLAAVSDVDFHVDQGEILGLIGPNGAGKTTLFNLISAAAKPKPGRIKFKGQDITPLPAYKICRLGIARTFQTVKVLAAVKNVLAGDLTLAQQKRLEVARALASDPQLLLLDELMAGLTNTEVEEAMKDIRQIRDRGITIIMIEHLMQAMMAISDRIVVLDYGRKIAEGTPQEVASNPKVIEVYLGEECDAAS